MTTATLPGVDVGYEDEGPSDGPALVLIHGHPFDRSMWRPQIGALNRTGWRVVAPDLRGYGQTSTAPEVATLPGVTSQPGVTTLDVFAHDIVRLLDHLGIRRFVLAGVSMGGQIAMEVHRLFPRRLRGLVLMDTSARAETAEGRLDRYRIADRLDQAGRVGMASYADELLPRMVAPTTLASRPEVARHVLNMMRATSPAGAAAALRGRAERPDYVGTLGRVAVPSLVVVGRHDHFTPVEEARRLHDRLPDSTLLVVEGAGHLPNLERPDEVNAALQRFLDPLDQHSQTYRARRARQDHEGSHHV